MRFIHILNVVAAVPWCIAMALMVINWSMGEPVTPGMKYCVVFSLGFTTVVTIKRAIEGIEALALDHYRSLDRRPGRGR